MRRSEFRKGFHRDHLRGGISGSYSDSLKSPTGGEELKHMLVGDVLLVSLPQ
jgi:hypothetical protein